MKQNKELVASLSGNSVEPDVVKGFVGKTDLIKTLNWYAANATDDELKSYLLLHSKTIDLNKPSISVLRTYGAIARCIQRGYLLTDDIVQRFDCFVAENQKVKQKQEQPNVITKGKSDSKLHLENIDIGIDCAIRCKTHQLGDVGSSVVVKECLDYINSHIKQNDSDYLNKGIDRKSYLRIKDYLEGLQKFYSVQKTSTKRVVTKKRISNTQIVKSVKYSTESKPFAKKPLTPIDLIKKKKVWVYDCNKKMLICYIAVLDGFTFKGTTLQNVDEEKSTSKRVKDENVLSQSLSELNKTFNGLKSVEKKPTPRFNQDMIILACS